MYYAIDEETFDKAMELLAGGNSLKTAYKTLELPRGSLWIKIMSDTEHADKYAVAKAAQELFRARQRGDAD